MNTPLRPARLDWSQGSPRSADFGDIYFSVAGGDAETRHVFLDGNDLEARFLALAPDQSFTIAETGFGTGLNWLCTQDLWERCGRKGWLHVASIEKHPLTATDLQQAQAAWPVYTRHATLLQRHYPALVPGFHRLVFPELRSTLTLVFADVEAALPHLHASVDAWFLDGFAPSRNPGMWQESLYTGMARLSHCGTTFATFTAAGSVRRGLQQAGFSVIKTAGHGKKREMLRGHFNGTPAERSPSPDKPWLHRPRPATSATAPRHAVIIGAGIAGASTAQALAARGWRVTVLEKENVAGGASGNPAAIVALSAATSGQDALSHFPQQASLHTLRVLNSLPAHIKVKAAANWHACGVLELPARQRRRTFAGHRGTTLPDMLWQTVDAATASSLSATTVEDHAVWQPQAGWLDAAGWCRHLLDHPRIHLRESTEVTGLEPDTTGWRLTTQRGERLHAGIVILANSHDADTFPCCRSFSLRKVRGQISRVSPSASSARLRTVICEQGYITPVDADGLHCLGASFVPDDAGTDIRLPEHESVRQLVTRALPALGASLPACESWQGRSGVRCQSEDYLPLIGPIADTDMMTTHYAGLRQGLVTSYPLLQPLPGLYAHLAHGSHGFSHSLLAAEILASEINDEPAPCSRQLLDALHPMRFLIRQLKRGKT